MSKILIVGDIHLGVRNNSLSYLNFQTDWFRNELFPLITKEKIDHLVFLGDVFDNRTSVSLIVLQRARELFKELTDINIDTHCILGNHDIAFRNNKSIHSLGILEDQGVKVYEKPTELLLSGSKVLMLPWVVKDEQDSVMELLAKNNYDSCFGHLEINDFEMVPGLVENKGFKQDLFSNCKNVFSGHFHLRRKHKNINYVGTPYELTWSDHLDQKGVTILDTKTNTQTFIPTKYTPKHIKLAFDGCRVIDKTEIYNNILNVKFTRNVGEVDKINIISRINALEPISCAINEDLDDNVDSTYDIESSIKDTIGFLTEYLSVVEIPPELDSTILREKLVELYENCV
jgi:DNA repair exonuclease SbcCD nuclease subunit